MGKLLEFGYAFASLFTTVGSGCLPFLGFILLSRQETSTPSVSVEKQRPLTNPGVLNLKNKAPPPYFLFFGCCCSSAYQHRFSSQDEREGREGVWKEINDW